jgi:hypothetical protein
MRLAPIVLALVLASPIAALAQDGETGDTSASAPTSSASPDRSWLHRSSVMFTPSALASFGGGRTTDFGAGAQLRLDYYPTGMPVRVGGWVSGEVLADTTTRVAGGLVGGMWLFDCQIGVAYRAATDRFAGSLGLQIGKSIDLGWVTIGGRLTIPLVDFTSPNSSQQTQGIEGAVVLTVGIPTTLDGDTRQPFDCPRREQIRDACPCHRRAHADDDATSDAPAAPTTPAS